MEFDRKGAWSQFQCWNKFSLKCTPATTTQLSLFCIWFWLVDFRIPVKNNVHKTEICPLFLTHLCFHNDQLLCCFKSVFSHSVTLSMAPAPTGLMNIIQSLFPKSTCSHTHTHKQNHGKEMNLWGGLVPTEPLQEALLTLQDLSLRTSTVIYYNWLLHEINMSRSLQREGEKHPIGSHFSEKSSPKFIKGNLEIS